MEYIIEQIQHIPDNIVANLLTWPICWLFWKLIHLFCVWLKSNWKNLSPKTKRHIKKQKWFTSTMNKIDKTANKR